MSDYTNRPNNTDYTNRQTYVRETEKSSGASMAFIVGGLVVAVGVIAWALSGGDIDVTTTPTPAVENSTTNVTIEPATPAIPTVDVTPAEPAAPVEPAPATPAPAGN